MAEPKKLKSGNWRILVYDYTDENGKRKYKSFTAPTKREAQYAADEYLHNRGSHSGYDDLTLAEAYRRYIDSKSEVLSPSTVAGYEGSARTDFSRLMPIKLSKLTPELVQIAVNDMAVNHSSKTVRNAHGLLSAVLKMYRPQFVLNTRLPQKVKTEPTIPTTEDINKLLAAANDFIRVPILLASSGSLRRSEICALTPEDVTDFGVNVNKAVVYNSERKAVAKVPKTDAGYRFVPLPTEIIQEVRAWTGWGCTPAKLTGAFCALVRKADVPRISFHKLRHYFASELHARGVPDKYIAKVGGWGNVAVLQNIYQHAMRDKQGEMSEKIINVFSGKFDVQKLPKENQA